MDIVHAIYPIYGNNSGKPSSHIECITRNKTMVGMKHEIIYECLAINPIAITSGYFLHNQHNKYDYYERSCSQICECVSANANSGS